MENKKIEITLVTALVIGINQFYDEATAMLLKIKTNPHVLVITIAIVIAYYGWTNLCKYLKSFQNYLLEQLEEQKKNNELIKMQNEILTKNNLLLERRKEDIPITKENRKK